MTAAAFCQMFPQWSTEEVEDIIKNANDHEEILNKLLAREIDESIPAKLLTSVPTITITTKREVVVCKQPTKTMGNRQQPVAIHKCPPLHPVVDDT